MAQRLFILHKSAQRLGKLVGAPRLDQLARISIRQNLRDTAYRRGDDRTARLACYRDRETEGLGMGCQDEYPRLPQQRLRRFDSSYEMRRSGDAKFYR